VVSADRRPFLSEEIGSLLKGGAKVCQQKLVNEVLAPLVTEFALNLGREGATPIQRAFDGSLSIGSRPSNAELGVVPP
jgi:hypothetical protein